MGFTIGGHYGSSRTGVQGHIRGITREFKFKMMVVLGMVMTWSNNTVYLQYDSAIARQSCARET